MCLKNDIESLTKNVSKKLFLLVHPWFYKFKNFYLKFFTLLTILIAKTLFIIGSIINTGPRKGCIIAVLNDKVLIISFLHFFSYFSFDGANSAEK